MEVEVGDEMMPGVVSLPAASGTVARDQGLEVASLQPGVNANGSPDELPLDVPSGTHIANGSGSPDRALSPGGRRKHPDPTSR